MDGGIEELYQTAVLEYFHRNDERFANIFQDVKPTLSVVDISWSASSSFLVVDGSEWFLWF